jgi:hypothetical protein
MHRRFVLSLLAAAALLVALGCGDDDDGSAGGSAAGSGGSAAGSGGSTDGEDAGPGGEDAGAEAGDGAAEVVKETITAADGGSVATDGDTAKIVIPAGALAEDTEISIETLAKADQPDAENLGSDAFDIGPDGTTFEKPVTLTLKLDGSVPADMVAKLAVLNGDKWEVIAGSTVSGSEVSAEIDHLSTFVIIFVGAQAVVINPDCAEFEFEPCGGDLVGTWEILDMCASATVGDNPFADTPECADIVFQVDMDFTGTVEFNADGSYASEVVVGAATMHAEYTEACMQAMWQAGGSETCDAIPSSSEDTVCSYADSVCSCDQAMSSGSGTQTETGTYSVSGNSLTMTPDSGDVTESEYCVSGDKATFGVPSDSAQDATFNHIILQKQ